MDTGHLYLLHNDIGKEMGGLVFCLCWICWVMQKAIIELFEEFLGGSKCWRAHSGEHYSDEIWKAIPLCMMWFLWREDCTYF